MMAFEVEDHGVPRHSKTSSNFIALHKEEDTKKLQKLQKYGFFYGNSSRTFSMSLTLPKPASLPLFKKPLQLAYKSKKSPFLKELFIGAQSRDFTAREEVKLGNLLRRSRNLSKFLLEKKWTVSINDRLLQRLSRNFSKLYSLNQVKLDLYGCTEIKAEGCKAMGKGLSRSLKLEFLELLMVGCNGINVDGFQYMTYRLSKLKNLNTLYLDLSNCASLRAEMTPLRLQNTIGKLTTLRSLKLLFNYDTLVGDDGAVDIAKTVGKLKNLRSVHLGLGFCSVSNTGLSKLSEEISTLPNLEELNLEFWGCTGIDNESVRDLAQAIAKLRGLRKIELNFTNCTRIGDSGFKSVVSAMKELEGLEVVGFALFKCEELSDESMQELVRVLYALKRLRRVEMNLAECKQISEYGVEALKSQLMSLPNLKDSVNIFR